MRLIPQHTPSGDVWKVLQRCVGKFEHALSLLAVERILLQSSLTGLVARLLGKGDIFSSELLRLGLKTVRYRLLDLAGSSIGALFRLVSQASSAQCDYACGNRMRLRPFESGLDCACRDIELQETYSTAHMSDAANFILVIVICYTTLTSVALAILYRYLKHCWSSTDFCGSHLAVLHQWSKTVIDKIIPPRAWLRKYVLRPRGVPRPQHPAIKGWPMRQTQPCPCAPGASTKSGLAIR